MFVTVGALLFFMLLAVQSTYGLAGMWTKTVPSDPVAGQSIKFTVYTGNPSLKFYFVIFHESSGVSCTAMNYHNACTPVYATQMTSDAATDKLIEILEA